jgi:NAD-dependent deacetylase
MAEKGENLIDFPKELLERIRAADHVLALTGAGISAESGIPTFRQAQTGLWAKYRPEELATPQAFQDNPAQVWEWYAWRRELIRQARPNQGHRTLAYMESRIANFSLITQNVDGLHQQAGSLKVIEFHGNIFRTKCSQEDRVVDARQDDHEIPPRCPHCQHFLRPDVVWFGESIPQKALSTALELVNTCQVFLSIGTSGLVEPAASLSFLARRQGSLLVEINLEQTPLTDVVDFSFQGLSGKILPNLVHALWPEYQLEEE